MSTYVKQNGQFELDEPLYRDCPHCQAHAQLLPVATPSFDVLMATRPQHTGVVFECASCRKPRFGRLAVRSFGPERIELSTNVVELERMRERFQLNYLPESVQPLFREALDCYTADLHIAFGIMCRRVVRAAMVCTERNEGAKLPDLYGEIVEVAELDYDTSRLLKSLLFDDETPEPLLGADQAAVLIEVIRDLFYQCYVRRAKLRAALRMRRFFAGESNQNVTPITGRPRRADSA